METVLKLADSHPPSCLDKELHKYRSIAWRAEVVSFQNTGLCGSTCWRRHQLWCVSTACHYTGYV